MVKSSWFSVAFQIGCGFEPLQQGGFQVVIFGVARGQRNKDDKKGFFVAVTLPCGKYPEHFDWTLVARERLDTFFECPCEPPGLCAMHQSLMAEWDRADKLLFSTPANVRPV